MKKLRSILLLCAAALLIGGIGVYAVGSYGSENDPLITLSYLEKVLRPELERQFSEETDKAAEALREEQTDSGSYTPVTLKGGQTMICAAGCEFLVRSGSAYVSDGMLNLTAGAEVKRNDWLLAHNLYMAVVQDAYVTATGDTTLMVRGEYNIE